MPKGKLMRLLILLLLISSSNVFALKLKAGDILLQPLNCWVCKLIEKQENSIYSHMAIVLKVEGKKVLVAHAWDKVKAVDLNEFNAMTRDGGKLMVRRHVSKRSFEDLYDLYMTYFDGVEYDKEFLWNNDKLYCSEFVYKLFNIVTDELTPPKKMRYDYGRDYWLRYFNGKIPDGLDGNSPADFEKSKYFKTIGFI